MENSTCTFCKCVESWFQYRKCSSERTAFNEWILYGIHKSMTFIHQLFTHSFSQIQIWFGMFVSTLFVHNPNVLREFEVNMLMNHLDVSIFIRRTFKWSAQYVCSNISDKCAVLLFKGEDLRECSIIRNDEIKIDESASRKHCYVIQRNSTPDCRAYHYDWIIYSMIQHRC